MELHVVARPTAGYAREDAGSVGVVGAYSDAAVADKVRRLSGFDAKVERVTVDVIPVGFLRNAGAFGIVFGPKDFHSVLAEELPADWSSHVAEAWKSLREHNNTIPDDVLDMMRDILLAHSPRS